MNTPMSEAERTAYMAAPQWTVFACDGQWFALPIAGVREILPARPITRLPGCGPEVCGLVGLRGRVITVFDLGVVLGLAPAADEADFRLILLDYDERVVGFAVAEMVAVTRARAAEFSLSTDELRTLDIARDDLIGVGTLGARPFTALDPEPILERLLV